MLLFALVDQCVYRRACSIALICCGNYLHHVQTYLRVDRPGDYLASFLDHGNGEESQTGSPFHLRRNYSNWSIEYDTSTVQSGGTIYESERG